MLNTIFSEFDSLVFQNANPPYSSRWRVIGGGGTLLKRLVGEGKRIYCPVHILTEDNHLPGSQYCEKILLFPGNNSH